MDKYEQDFEVEDARAQTQPVEKQVGRYRCARSYGGVGVELGLLWSLRCASNGHHQYVCLRDQGLEQLVEVSLASL